MKLPSMAGGGGRRAGTHRHVTGAQLRPELLRLPQQQAQNILCSSNSSNEQRQKQ
jgi:hypothetical protein